VDGEPPELGRYLHPALREVIDLLKGESDHEGCMENSQEGLAMGIGNFRAIMSLLCYIFIMCF
jgi:hypothetical protein